MAEQRQTMWYAPSEEREHLDGVQRVYRFEGSRYSASVVQHDYSYGHREGLWELAVKYDDRIVDSPITAQLNDQVIGWLSEDEVQTLLSQIDALQDRSEVNDGAICVR
jgi:hypothetical protein